VAYRIAVVAQAVIASHAAGEFSQQREFSEEVYERAALLRSQTVYHFAFVQLRGPDDANVLDLVASAQADVVYDAQLVERRRFAIDGFASRVHFGEDVALLLQVIGQPRGAKTKLRTAHAFARDRHELA